MLKTSRNDWPDYIPQSIEPKWQSHWENGGLYRAHAHSDKPKYYCLDFFPYPSGDGLHVGHCRNYVPTDVMSRFKRMQGFNVLHPMGWDAFGEPAEQYAVAHGVHPRITTDQNTANFRRQMQLIGAGYDWSREIDSSKPEFYQWTQYFFLLLYQRGLAYRDTNWQWWCPGCQTTLSSHEVSNGVCWRGHTGVNKREIPAWYFRITANADRLLAGLDGIDWPERIKTIQRNWIGRSAGCEIIFHTEKGLPVPVFTTRPDTIFGATFFVLAPEHPLVADLTTFDRVDLVAAYQNQAARQSEIERMSENREITGVFTGGYVINPLNDERIPVWIADYVLPSYGSGAVMGVPAHDERDFEFAQRNHLPVRVVVIGSSEVSSDPGSVYTGPGQMINSAPYDGMSNMTAAKLISEELQRRNFGGAKVQYRMRDWLISRQRYWGTPIPIVYCDIHGAQPVPVEQLPVLLPPMDDFQPDGSGLSPLARIPEFLNTTCPVCCGPARRETDTMGGFACSSWYFLRFTSPHYTQGPFEPEEMRYWMPVDLYVGGAEHAVLHLLYARFWTEVLADAGILNFSEPFSKLLNQGQLLAPDGSRMSKSRGNVITPDSMVEIYGADALRIYELFMAPFDQDITWNQDGIQGALRFLNRLWTLIGETYSASRTSAGRDADLERWMHKTIKRCTERMDSFRFNTLISSLMEFVNQLVDRWQAGQWHTSSYHSSLDILLLLLAPIAPHICEELWSLTDHSGSVHQQPWPEWNPEVVQDEFQEIAIQVNGRLREVIRVSVDATEEEIQKRALGLANVQTSLAGQTPTKIYYIPGKIFSIVTKVAKEAGK